MFSGGIEREQWHEIRSAQFYYNTEKNQLMTYQLTGFIW